MNAVLAGLIIDSAQEMRSHCVRPLAQAHRSKPQHYHDDSYGRWVERVGIAEENVVNVLQGMGAQVTKGEDSYRIAYLGIDILSHLGLLDAIGLWLITADRRLAREAVSKPRRLAGYLPPERYRRSAQRHNQGNGL